MCRHDHSMGHVDIVAIVGQCEHHSSYMPSCGIQVNTMAADVRRKLMRNKNKANRQVISNHIVDYTG